MKWKIWTLTLVTSVVLLLLSSGMYLHIQFDLWFPHTDGFCIPGNVWIISNYSGTIVVITSILFALVLSYSLFVYYYELQHQQYRPYQTQKKA